MGAKKAEQTMRIAAAPADCFVALTGYEDFPEWQRAVKACEVLTRYDDGRGHHVAFEIDAKVRTVSYTLAYSYEEPHRITWDLVEGDVKDVDGELLLEGDGDTTLATYRVALDPGMWVPGPVKRMVEDQVMRGSLEDLKRRVEGG
ncbi:MAG: SRPBCC family protein [Thermoleophilaceae bacterium]